VKENDGIAVYNLKETILKGKAANITLRDRFLFYLIRELSDRLSYNSLQWNLDKRRYMYIQSQFALR
jgi:hypothetical protein